MQRVAATLTYIYFYLSKVRLLECMQVGQAFADAADQYVRKFLNNGVPSLFSDLKPLYRYCCGAQWSDAPLIHTSVGAVLCCAVLCCAVLCCAVLL